ncbi:Crp/Fnr family transcriptional regulator [Alkaliphilus peptidifermentans]|uniref:cAMP-binding domain of CRP or a regulatory subunit of cAMP-dependent protein kinases n=1 Tax=Alkaliphilus peptidifermentans DSM 18978 TaxID=1120976 RepID=A0A1G5IJ68_9FIRM|nr:Crp/Fnr family transcriptional regulator [Alkaliphilus peptidifermentans]SCY76112.1 cAMP-binding domain of CRP or a regulatory subunit of cAMP-dependent protein kinases [Alkaliphilus peptidifermentans DSM 18978]
MHSIIKLLGNCTLFNHLSIDELTQLLSDITYNIKYYNKNQVVFSPHHSSDTLGIILDGSVDVQKIFASGKAVTVNRKFQYDLIEDASIFANIDYYPSSISTCENSRILLINKNNILKLFSKDEKIMFKYLQSVSNRVLALNTIIEILSLNSVHAKIAYFLLVERNTQNSNIIKLKFSKKSWAEHLNVSRPTLSRELRNMNLEGIISFNKRTIEIHQIEKLEKLCSI